MDTLLRNRDHRVPGQTVAVGHCITIFVPEPLISLPVDGLCPCRRSAEFRAGQVRGITPFPEVASASRRLVPSVVTRWAWWRSRIRRKQVLGGLTHEYEIAA